MKKSSFIVGVSLLLNFHCSPFASAADLTAAQKQDIISTSDQQQKVDAAQRKVNALEAALQDSSKKRNGLYVSAGVVGASTGLVSFGLLESGPMVLGVLIGGGAITGALAAGGTWELGRNFVVGEELKHAEQALTDGQKALRHDDIAMYADHVTDSQYRAAIKNGSAD